MRIRDFYLKVLPVLFLLFVTANAVMAAGDTKSTAEERMIWQLEALKDGDLQRFCQYGNKAFKDIMKDWGFNASSLESKKELAKGYQLEHLGSIRRLGMRTHLWRVRINGEEHELLGSLTLTKYGKVCGFHIE